MDWLLWGRLRWVKFDRLLIDCGRGEGMCWFALIRCGKRKDMHRAEGGVDLFASDSRVGRLVVVVGVVGIGQGDGGHS